VEQPENKRDGASRISVTRRTFLKLLVAGVIAFIGVRSLDLLKPAVIEAPESMATTTVKKSSVTTSAISPSSKLASVVVVRGALGMDPQVLVDKALELLGGVEKFVPAGGSILVKPNVGFYEMDAVTDPKVVAAVVRSLRHARPARIVVGESSVRGHDTQHALSVTGVRAAAEQAGAEVRDMRKDPAVTVNLPKGRAITSVEVFKTVLDSSFIVDVPRLKRHSATVATIGLKNMMGVLPDSEKGRFHEINLNQCIADLNSEVRPNLVIIDATRVMTRRGPTGGVMVDLNLVIASLDPVAADVVAAEELFKAEGASDPRGAVGSIEHIRRAAESGVGVADRSKIQVLEVSLS
jgi:uncharacterized protein (DUF362 family)